MKLNDTAAGLVILVVGLSVALYAQTFPPMPGQNVGPSLFPSLLGVGLAVAGLVLVVSGLRTRDTPLVSVDDWMRSPRLTLSFVLVIADLVLYGLVVDWLGFFPTSVLFLAVLFGAFGVKRAWIAPMAAAVTLAIHYGFYTLLRVPLPWGLLEGIAW